MLARGVVSKETPGDGRGVDRRTRRERLIVQEAAQDFGAAWVTQFT